MPHSNRHALSSAISLLVFAHEIFLPGLGPKIPLSKEIITVDPPKAGEVRLKVVASYPLYHTDIYTLDGNEPEGLFPCILGHEAGCVVESVGGTSVVPGAHAIPCYSPQCCEPDCAFCQSPKTNSTDLRETGRRCPYQSECRQTLILLGYFGPPRGTLHHAPDQH